MAHTHVLAVQSFPKLIARAQPLADAPANAVAATARAPPSSDPAAAAVVSS